MQNNSRNYIYIGIAIVVIVAAFLLLRHSSSPAPQTAGETATSPATSSSNTGLGAPSNATTATGTPPSLPPYHTLGKIDLSQIGGTGLTVSSGLSISTTATSTGVFAVLALDQTRLTILTASDNGGKPRGYAIAFPETTYVTINARSTAEASLIDPTADLPTSRKELAEIDTLKCFPAYVSYLQKELPVYSLDQIQKMTDPNDASNPHNACVKEIQTLVAS